MERIPVAILAGRPPERDALLQHADIDNKVLIQHKGETILEHCIRAAEPFASKFVVVGLGGDAIAYRPDVPIEFLDMEGEQYDKIFAAVQHLVDRGSTRALFMSGDLPLLRSDHIGKFLDQTGPADFYYSIIPEEVFERQAPNLEWGYMKIRDGKFASGNLILIDPRKIVDKYDMIKFLSTNRKSFILGVLRASPLIFIKLILGRVRLHDAERLMTKMFGIESKLVICNNFEVAFDLDLPEHLDWLRTKESENQ